MSTRLIEIPVLETDRLILRAHRADDLDAMEKFFATDRSRFVGGPMGRGDCWRAMMRGAGHWVLRGYGVWHIEDKASGKVAGWAGIIHHIEWPEPELAWTLFEGFEGKGIAYEAACAARNHAAAHFGIDRPVSMISAENHRSRALAERLGATFERSDVVNNYPCDIFRHTAAEDI